MIKKYIPLLLVSAIFLSPQANAFTSNDFLDAIDAYDGSFGVPSSFSIYGVDKVLISKEMAGQATKQAVLYIENNPFVASEQSRSYEWMSGKELGVNLNAFTILTGKLPTYEELAMIDDQKIDALGKVLMMNHWTMPEVMEVSVAELTPLQKDYLKLQEKKSQKLTDEEIFNNWIYGATLGSID